MCHILTVLTPPRVGMNHSCGYIIVPLNDVFEPLRDKTNKIACVPSEDSDQPGHPPSLIRVFAVRLKKARILSYPLSAQRTLWSDWADAQADLSLRWAHMPLCWFCHKVAHFVTGNIMRPINFHNVNICNQIRDILLVSIHSRLKFLSSYLGNPVLNLYSTTRIWLNMSPNASN